MATFNWEPGIAAMLDEQPRVLITEFGDGYQQRTGDGINTTRQIWSLTFNGKLPTEADAIILFLRQQLGYIAFDWVPPDRSASIKVICRQWRRQVADKAVSTITATFEQVFDQ